MSFWTDILALNPSVLWKLDETTGTQATDATGQLRHGTWVNQEDVDKGQATLIPNEPASGSVALDGVNEYAAITTSAAWMNGGNNMTAITFIKPTNFSVKREPMGKTNRWQVWITTAGIVQFYVTPAWTNVNSGALVADRAYMLAVRKDHVAGLISIWLGDLVAMTFTKVAELAHTGVLAAATNTPALCVGRSSTAPGYVLGRQQMLAYWADVALTDAQLNALWTSAIAPVSQPPSDVTLLGANVVSATLVGASWPAAVDPEGGAVTYTLEYRDAALAWQPVASGIVPLTYDWAPPVAMAGLLTQLRIKALDPFGIASGWTLSDEFLLTVTLPTEIVVTPGTETTLVSWNNAALVSNVEYWDGAFWRPLATGTASNTYTWDTSKRKGIGVKVRVQLVDGAIISAWVESATFVLTGKFYGNIWSALQSYASLEVLYKLDDAAGLPVDSSGKGRTATAVASLTYQHPSVIFNKPNDESIRKVCVPPCGSGLAVLHSGGVWYDSLVTMMVWVSGANGWGGSASGLLQLFGRGFIHGNAAVSARNLRLTITGGAAFAELGDLPAGNSLLTMVMPKGVGSRVAAFYNNAVKFAGLQDTLAASQVRFGSTESTDSYYQGAAAFSEEFDALQIGWLYQVSLNAPNELPALPVITSPIAQNYDLAVAVTWNASVDPEGNSVQYKGEYTRGDGVWLPLFDWQAGTTYAWDTTLVVLGGGFKVRVKARDLPYEEETAWAESAAFNIVHVRAIPNAPALSWIWAADRYLGFLTAAFSSAVPEALPGSTQWRYSTLQDMSNIVKQFTIAGAGYRFGVNPKGNGAARLSLNTNYWVDACFVDNIGRVGPRCSPVRARTSRVETVNAAIIMRDSSPNARHGTYGVISGNDGSAYRNHGLGWSGMRFPKFALNSALLGYGGFLGDLVDSEQVRGLWRVNSGDPKVISAPVRTDNLKGTLSVLVPITLNGEPACSPARHVFNIASNYGILLRLFVPATPITGRRYGVFGFRGPTIQNQNVMYMRMMMMNGNLFLQGIRGFDRGVRATSCDEDSFNYAADVAGLQVGTVPVGSIYTLRLWGKAAAYLNYNAISEAESGLMHIRTNYGYSNLGDTMSMTQTVGVQGGWVDIGYDATNPPNISGGANTFPGAVLDFAAWNHPAQIYSSLEEPWIATAGDDVTAAAIASSPGLEFHYKMDDPNAPNTPTLSEV